jgi:hypothetical protein
MTSVPDIAAAVQATIDALLALESHTGSLSASNEQIRSLVLPLTIAGCHATSSSRQFFRDRFQRLSPEASAFGNTQSALRIMEEVWRRREMTEKKEEVCWREVMGSLGWRAGVLLI